MCQSKLSPSQQELTLFLSISQIRMSVSAKTEEMCLSIAFIHLYFLYIFFFCHLTGGWHGKSDQDQRERPMGGRVQGQARPLSFHPRSTVGTTPPRWRELRNTRTPITSTVSSTSLLLRSFCHARKEKKIYSSTQLMNLWAKPVRHSWLRQCKTCWVILPNVLLMSLH